MADQEPLAILPKNMGQPGAIPKAKPEPRKFIPSVKGGLVLTNPQEEQCPYTFSDSPAYLRQKKEEERAKRAVELESRDETRGFLKSVEDLAKKQKWDEALQVLDRRTAVPSGLFLVTRAVLRWKFGKYSGALRDAEEALSKYGSSAKAGPLAAAFASFARICTGSEASSKGSCSKEMKELVTAWEQAEQRALAGHTLGQGLFHPRKAERLPDSVEIVDGMTARDGSYVATSGVRVGYVLLQNRRDMHAPFIVHFHGSNETAADYRSAALAEKYRDLPAHLLVVDYRGYGWSAGEPSLATLLRDAEPVAEKLPELMVQSGLSWPYPGGLVLSGRSLGAQVAVHLAMLYPELFRALVLDSALATSATGDRLGRAPERSAALARWRRELDDASLEILQPLDEELWGLSALDKIRSFDGQFLVLHGLADETVPYEGSESLHSACGSRRKELVLVEGAGHNDIGHSSDYWTALRRLALKAQLDDQLPSVGPTVEHLCAVCAEKATSKCGRCMKVWYCSRSHQAEHWKTHKNTCGGGPPEPKPKVEPEGEACVVAAMAAKIRTVEDVAALTRALLSTGAQEEGPKLVHLSWYAPSQVLAEKVAKVLEDVREAYPSLPLQARQWPIVPGPEGHFQLLQAVVPTLMAEAPAYSWVAFPELAGFWSPRNVASLLPALRKAAPDSRVVALNCTRLAKPKGEGQLGLDMAMQVEAALASGAAERSEAAEPGLGDVVVRLKVFQAFLEATPEPALAHELCLHRFMQFLKNSFGKKVRDFKPPDGEWMRWMSKPKVASAGSLVATDDDFQLGANLMKGFKQANPPSEQYAEGEAEGKAEGEGDASGRRTPFFADAEEAASAVAALRREIERKVILSAGDKMAAKDLRSIATEHVGAFLEANGLREMVGIHGWAKAAAAELSETAAMLFKVEVVASEPK